MEENGENRWEHREKLKRGERVQQRRAQLRGHSCHDTQNYVASQPQLSNTAATSCCHYHYHYSCCCYSEHTTLRSMKTCARFVNFNFLFHALAIHIALLFLKTRNSMRHDTVSVRE